jgi:ribonuclease D
VEELLGVHLAKEHSAADWSTRPLPQTWLVYAALDVELLVDLRDAIDERLRTAHKSVFAEQEFQAELDKEEKPPRADPWRRLSGIHSVKGLRNLAVARELWLARDQLARELDTAPGPDLSLTAVARALPSSKRELAGLKEFTGRASRAEIDRWWAAVEAGRTTRDLPVLRGNGDGMPPARVWAERNPLADARLKAAKPEIAQRAEYLEMPMENLLTPETLRRVAWEPPQQIDEDSIADALLALGARPWQVEATAGTIAAAFVEAHQSADEAADSGS